MLFSQRDAALLSKLISYFLNIITSDFLPTLRPQTLMLLTTLTSLYRLKKKIWGKYSLYIRKFRMHRMQRHIKEFLIYEKCANIWKPSVACDFAPDSCQIPQFFYSALDFGLNLRLNRTYHEDLIIK
jgi:hypothetical protein